MGHERMRPGGAEDAARALLLAPVAHAVGAADDDRRARRRREGDRAGRGAAARADHLLAIEAAADPHRVPRLGGHGGGTYGAQRPLGAARILVIGLGHPLVDEQLGSAEPDMADDEREGDHEAGAAAAGAAWQG